MSELSAVYQRYLRCLNERRWNDLDLYVAEDVVYNGERIGLRGYREMLEADTAAIPDLEFVPEILLAVDDVVSCRLFFTCTPAHSFLGFEPTGEQIAFAEHVYYRFVDESIAEVWSVIDKSAIAEQLTQKP